MFKNSIVSTPLTTDAANAYFSNITGQKYGNDNSFLATLRALVAPRMKEEDAIVLKFGRTDYNAGAIRSVPGDRAVRAICDSYYLDDAEGNVIIHNLTADTDSNLANLQILDSYFVGHYMGYHRLEKVKEFYRKAINVDCYINPEKKNVILFVDKLDNKKLHYLQQSILAILPWYFDPSNGVSELEMELIQSLRETTSEKYEDCLARVAEKYDFKTARIRQLLGGFETRFERMECDRVRGEIEDYDRRINMLNNDIGALLANRNESCIRLLGLETKIANGGEDSEIMDYFLCNHKLFLEEVTDTDMYFSVKDYLTYFDRDMAEVAINNPNSFVYHNGRNGEFRGVSAEKMKKLMREIFVEEAPRLRIKVCAAYRFSLNGSVGTQGGHNFGYEFNDAMPNTHIDRYKCLGNYQKTINQLLQRRDYIGALEQCIASCKSLNWGDSPVMGEFMRTMWGTSEYNYNNRCIELPDGRVVKPADAIKWLEEQDGEVVGQTATPVQRNQEQRETRADEPEATERPAEEIPMPF
nr:hypothetical protein [Acutalibacter muris]